MIIVAVVATIYTAGAASAFLGAVSSGIGAATSAAAAAVTSGAAFGLGTAALGGAGLAGVGAAMVGAAVGSAASQLAGKAMGVVDQFSWKQVGISALTAGVGGGINQLANSGVGWAKTAQSAIQSIGEVGTKWGTSLAVGAYYGAVSYSSSYVANQVFGNKQQFSWSSLGASVVGSMAGASLGRTGIFDTLGKASPYAYSLTGANTAAAIEDKWFGGARPDYVNVSINTN